MRHAAITPASSVTRLVAVGLAGCVALSVAAAAPSEAAARRNGPTTIVVSAGQPKGGVSPHQLGVNVRFLGNGSGLWDVEADQPNPVAVRRLRRTGVSDLRYPGGTIGNLFDWKKSIGDNRGCQTVGKERSGYSNTRATAYGVDEHMEVVEAAGGEATIMVPWITETPSDAADWVEYMNSPADGLATDSSNPNGGTDWAMLRADNGHVEPYGVRYWEIGNEQRVPRQRYWMSQRRGTALRQYANGDTVRIQDEMLGRDCSHRVAGSPSNGRPNQVFELLYPPVEPDSVTVQVLGAPDVTWQEVDTFDASTGTDPVYVVNEEAGTVQFGDGINGAILPQGATVRASYTSVHSSVFSFIEAMREVDPSIKACVTWGLKSFIRVAGEREYNCFAVHAYTNLKQDRPLRRATVLQAYDRSILGTNHETRFVREIKRALPRGVSVALTEFGWIWGGSAGRPHLSSSMMEATYLASMWVSWLDLAIPLAIGSRPVGGQNAMLGHAPHYTMTAEAKTRDLLRSLYAEGSRTLQLRVRRNPVRVPGGRTRGRYDALRVAATRTRTGDLRILVVNRLPTQRVRTKVDLRGFTSRRVASVSTVNGPGLRSSNTSTATEVHLKTDRRRIGRDSFTQVFRPHSVTVIEVPSRR